MVKRSVTKVKKESKMKQKQRQQQNVTVNIGTLAKKPRARKPTKPRQAPQPAQAPIITRGPTTYFQQPQPAPAQVQRSSINELYKLIKQQAQEKQPEQQPITTSIVPPPQIGEILKAVNELERTRKARVAKFEKPELQKVFEAANEDDGLDVKAYQDFNRFKSMTQLFREAEEEEKTPSLLNEPAPPRSLNLFSSGRIVPDYVSPDLSLQPSSLLDPPHPRLTRADTDTTDDSTPSENQNFMDMFSNSPSLKPVQTSQTLVSGIATEANEWFSERSVATPPTPERETFEEGAFEPEFVDDTEPAAEFQPEPSFTDESNIHPTVVDVQPKEEGEGESKEEITELNLGEAPPLPEPPNKAIYRGSANLPAIVQPRGEDTPLVQLLNPTAEPSLAAAVSTEVRPADEYRTETLVKGEGILEAEAREVPQGTPKEQLVAFAKNLGVKTASGTSGKHLKTELIRQNIYNKMGKDFEIPEFIGKKPGPQRTVENANEL